MPDVHLHSNETHTFHPRGKGKLIVRKPPLTPHEWLSMPGSQGEQRRTVAISLWRTKAALIDKTTGNLRAVQPLPGHTKLKSPVRHLGTDVDDALQISGQVELISYW